MSDIMTAEGIFKHDFFLFVGWKRRMDYLHVRSRAVLSSMIWNDLDSMQLKDFFKSLQLENQIKMTAHEGAIRFSIVREPSNQLS